MVDILAPNMKRWDFITHEYTPYLPPNDGIYCLFTRDMDLAINCTSCGKDMTYGQGRTSRTIHNEVGMGWPVCEDCYSKEWEAEKAAKEK